MNTINKKIITHIAIIISFALLSIAYFPSQIEGKKLQQSDTTQYKGMSKEIKDYKEQTDKQALWTNSMFGGMPSYLISFSNDANWIRFIDKVFKSIPRPAGYIFIALLSFYLLLLAFGASPFLAAIGAIGYGFSTYFFIILGAGHNSKMLAMAYFPGVLAGVHWVFQKKYYWGIAVFGLFMALELLAGHPQITYYGLLIVLVYGIFQLVIAIREKEYKSLLVASSLLFVMMLFSVGTDFTKLYLTYDYGKDSIRGKTELTTEKNNRTSGLDKDYATAWSYGKFETLNLLIPNLMGGGSSSDLGVKSETYKVLKEMRQPNAKQIVKNMPTYWGSQPFTSGPTYIGALLIFLFVLGMFIVKSDIKWWIFTATVLSISLAWGKNMMWLTDLFLDYFPAYNKFRAVSMILVIAEITIPLLAILSVNQILKGDYDKQKIQKQLLYALTITGGTILLLILGMSTSSGAFVSDADTRVFGQNQMLLNAIQTDRAHLFRVDAYRSLFFILVGAAAIWFYLKGKLKQNLLLAIIGFVILIDLWSVDKRYLNSDNFISKRQLENTFVPSVADQSILKDKSLDYRVLNIAVSSFNDASTSYFHKSIGGYHGAKMRRYQELIDYHISKEMQRFIAVLQQKPSQKDLYQILSKESVLNMLNTKYIIYNPQAPAIFNPYALGNAWFVSKIKWVNNADEEIQALQNFKPSEIAIADKKFQEQDFNFQKDTSATISLQIYQPDYLKYQTNTTKEQLAVFSEIYYEKGWNAYVDGEKQKHFRVDYVLRAMKIPTGKHTVEFRFEPKMYGVGRIISMISSAILLLMIILALWIEFKKKKEKK